MYVTIAEMADLEFALVFHHLEQAKTLKLAMHIHLDSVYFLCI